MENCLVSKTLEYDDSKTPEQKLWRAVLGQAVSDAFGITTLHLCDYEKKECKKFFEERTEDYDRLCEDAGYDADILWKKIQCFKLIKAGILKPNEKQKTTLDLIFSFEKKRNSYTQSHWRNNHVR